MVLDNFKTQMLIWDKAEQIIHDKYQANSGDSNGRKLRVQVLDGGSEVNLSGVQLHLAWRARGNKGQGLDALTPVDITKGIFEISYTTEMLSHIGEVPASLVLIESSGRTESSEFIIRIAKSMVDDDSVQSDNSFTALTSALVSVSQVTEQLAQNETELEVIKSTKMDKNTTGISFDQIDKNKKLLDESYLADSLKAVIAGTAPIGPVPADKSITNIKLANGAVNYAILSDGYNNRPNIDGAQGADLNSIVKTGIYLFINSPLNAPPGLNSGFLKNEVISQRWLYQEVRAVTTSSGTPVWQRVLDMSTGLGAWSNVANGFSGTINGASFDISTLKTPGYYYVYSEVTIGMPLELKGYTKVLEIKYLVEYDITIQKIYPPSNSQVAYTRQINATTVSGWSSIEDAVSPLRFPYLKDTDDLNLQISPGRWVAISPKNGPYVSTWNLEVKRFYTTKNSENFWGTQMVATTNISGPYDVYTRNFYNHVSNGLIFGSWTKLSNTESLEAGGSPLKGKIIVNFGDSIFGNTRGTNSVSNRIAERTGATVHNIGFGGSRIAQHSNYWDAFSIYRIADEINKENTDPTKWQLQDEAILASETGLVNGMPYYFKEHLNLLKTIDFSKVYTITIAGGTNDYTASVLLDNPTNKYDTATFAGSLRYSLEILMQKYKNLNVLIISPLYRFWRTETGEFIDDSDTRIYAGQGLPDFVETGSQVAKEYKVSFLDNYFELGINKFNKEEYFPDTDGTHPNATGNIKLGSKIGANLVSEF